MKGTIIALSAAAALVAAVPILSAQGISSRTPGVQHKISRKRPTTISGRAWKRELQAMGSKEGYPGAFGYAPYQLKDYTTDMSRQAGGGGGGGGGM